MGNGPPAILSGANGDIENARVIADQPHQRRPGIGRSCHNDLAVADPDLGPLIAAVSPADRVLELGQTIANNGGPPIDDDLGGRNIMPRPGIGIIPLALCKDRLGEGIFPAELVPIGHREIEREHIGPACGQRIEVGVGRRTR